MQIYSVFSLSDMGNNNSGLNKSSKDASKNNDNNKQSLNEVEKEEKNENKIAKIDFASLPEYTMEEVEKHDSKEKGVWIVLNNLVYNVTPFLPFHPGGAGFLLEVAGEDATQEFEAAIHSESARMKTREFVIGKLKKDKKKKQGLSLPTSFGNPQNNVCLVLLYINRYREYIHIIYKYISVELSISFYIETSIEISTIIK